MLGLGSVAVPSPWRCRRDIERRARGGGGTPCPWPWRSIRVFLLSSFQLLSI